MNITTARYPLLVTTLLTMGLQDAFGGLFWEDGFESTAPTMGGGTRSAPLHTNTDGSQCAEGNYFLRTSAADDSVPGFTRVFTGKEGTYLWRTEDLEDCKGTPDRIEWTGIDINGRTGLIIGGWFAARDTNIFEDTDIITLEWRIDGGAWATGLSFSGNAVISARLALNGASPLLDQTLTAYTFSPGATGMTLDLRVVVDVANASEEIAMDLFQVGDNGSLPVELQSFEIK